MKPKEGSGAATELGEVFTPAAPINEQSLFAGRKPQVADVLDAINQRGRHAIIFGERGVGKTSLANVLASRLSSGVPVIAPRVNCDNADTYTSLWRKIFNQISLTRTVRKVGFRPKDEAVYQQVNQVLPETLGPDDVRNMLTLLAAGVVLVTIIDEFDRLATRPLKTLMADTIKTLSDHAVRATMVVVGVADSVDELLEEHLSVERALVQVRMPRMSRDELGEILGQGINRLGMAMEARAINHITLVSQGLPHYTHLLGFYATREALDSGQRRVTLTHVEHAVEKALKQIQRSTITAYHKATASHRRDNLYRHVLLACALADTDELGYFAAADVRDPLTQIMGKPYDIPSYSRHLNDFCEDSRGPIFQKTGEERRFRFRFRNPLMQPYVTLQGISEGLITREQLERFAVQRRTD